MNFMGFNFLRMAGLALLCLAPMVSPAQTICYVSLDGDDSSGNSWATAFRTISNGISHAVSPTNTVLVGDGTYTVSTPITVYSGITVTSLNGRAWTSIDGGSASQCLRINHADAVVDGFTISNGVKITGSGSVDSGGGVWISKGTLRNCEISSNMSTWAGGGIYFDRAAKNALVLDCIIKNNWITNVSHPSYGGGIHLCGTGTVVRGCTISGNRTPVYGGGVSSYYGYGLLTSCIVSNNTASSGAGICFDGQYGATVTAAYCTVVNNSGGSAIYCVYGGDHVISDSTIANNAGGGIALSTTYLGKGPGIVSNCTISGNSAVASAGGISLYKGGVMQNCTVVSNYNTSDGAGGVGLIYDGGRMFNCLVAYNTASTADSRYGGGVWVNNMTNTISTISGCTIVSNLAYRGGGIDFISSYTTNFVVNCIIASNRASNAGNDFYNYPGLGESSNAFYHSFLKDTTLTAGNYNITNGEPQFIGAAGGNFRLLSTSPCINAGTNETWMIGAKDLDGRRRIDRFGGQVDMGAYEYLPSGTLFIAH